MFCAEQGDLLRISGIKYPVVVVSNDFFNRSGKAVVCPILRDVPEGPLHIRLKDSEVEGVVLCEQIKYLDLSARHVSRLSASHSSDIMDIADAVASMFDYQQR